MHNLKNYSLAQLKEIPKKKKKKDTDFCGSMGSTPRVLLLRETLLRPLTMCAVKLRVVRDRLVLNVDEFIKPGFVECTTLRAQPTFAGSQIIGK